MGRYNPAFMAMMQKIRERKRSQARARAANVNPFRRRKDKLCELRRVAVDPAAPDLHPAPKIRLSAELIPPEMVRPDQRRGQGHYDALDNAQPKGKPKRMRPIVAAHVRQFKPDRLPPAMLADQAEAAWSDDHPAM